MKDATIIEAIRPRKILPTIPSVVWEFKCGYQQATRFLSTLTNPPEPMTENQEPKYLINEKGQLQNRQSGNLIPEDEPVFILRARDRQAVTILHLYAFRCNDPEQTKAATLRAQQFEKFAREHPDRMKEPDTALTDAWKDLH